MKRAVTQLRYQCEKSAQWAIGATRCDDKRANTVLLETQGPKEVYAGAEVTQKHMTQVYDGRCHKSTILVLHLLYHRWEHARPTSLHQQLLLLEYLQLQYDTTRFDQFLVLESFRS